MSSKCVEHFVYSQLACSVPVVIRRGKCSQIIWAISNECPVLRLDNYIMDFAGSQGLNTKGMLIRRANRIQRWQQSLDTNMQNASFAIAASNAEPFDFSGSLAFQQQTSISNTEFISTNSSKSLIASFRRTVKFNGLGHELFASIVSFIQSHFADSFIQSNQLEVAAWFSFVFFLSNLFLPNSTWTF